MVRLIGSCKEIVSGEYVINEDYDANMLVIPFLLYLYIVKLSDMK